MFFRALRRRICIIITLVYCIFYWSKLMSNDFLFMTAQFEFNNNKLHCHINYISVTKKNIQTRKHTFFFRFDAFSMQDKP